MLGDWNKMLKFKQFKINKIIMKNKKMKYKINKMSMTPIRSQLKFKNIINNNNNKIMMVMIILKISFLKLHK